MNNISPVYSVNNYYVPAFKQKAVNNTSAPDTVNSNVSMRGVDALAAYNMGTVNKSQNNMPEYYNLSFDEHLASLKAKGKKEGADYKIESYPNGTTWIELTDKDGNETDRIEYIDGKFMSCEVNTFKNGKLISSVGIMDDRIETSSKIYYRDNFPQEKFTKSGINHETTPEQFMEYLKKNNIDYKVSYEGEEENNRSVWLAEYDKDGKKVRSYWWYYGERKFGEQFPWVSVSELNDNEEEVRRICFTEDSSEVCDYGYFSKTKDYNNSEIDVKTLTAPGVTYNTTPEEYIKYLEDNGINYRIKKTSENSNYVEIEEFDKAGKVITNMCWLYDLDTKNLNYICRWELSDKGRKRFDFCPDTTETMTIRYA